MLCTECLTFSFVCDAKRCYNETITLAGKGLSWKCAHFLAFSGKCVHFMQIRQKCAHFLAFSGKCTHFLENACILCKLGENARILCKLGENARIFSGNAHILCKLGENTCIFTENARISIKIKIWTNLRFRRPINIGLSYIYTKDQLTTPLIARCAPFVRERKLWLDNSYSCSGIVLLKSRAAATRLINY